MDWGQPYTCSSWATSFGQNFPILDDGNGSAIYGLFGVGYVPHNVVIGGDGLVIFSESGFNENTMIAMIEEGLENLILDVDEDGVFDSDDNCVETSNPNQEDIDIDGFGDACDPCDNLNVFTFGNINGTVDQQGNTTVDVFDVMELVDILLNNDQSSCGSEIADLNTDGNENVVDIIYLVQMLLGGDFQNSFSTNPALFEVQHSIESDRVLVSSESKIGGIQFRSNISTDQLDNLSVPNGWIVDYVIKEEQANVMLFDISGQNPLNQLELAFNDLQSSSFDNIIIADDNARQINVSVVDKNLEESSKLAPDLYGLQSLYPNPFNPSLNVAFSLERQGVTSVSIFNSLGEEVSRIIDKQFLEPGQFSINWNAVGQPSGLYLVRLQTNDLLMVKKALLVK